MDKIRIWFKDEFYTSYYENVTSWEFDGEYFKFKNDEGEHYICTRSIKQVLIGSMEEEGKNAT